MSIRRLRVRLTSLADAIQHFLAFALLINGDPHVDAAAADRGGGHRLVAQLVRGYKIEDVGAGLEDEHAARFAQGVKILADKDGRRAEFAFEPALPDFLSGGEFPAD